VAPDPYADDPFTENATEDKAPASGPPIPNPFAEPSGQTEWNPDPVDQKPPDDFFDEPPVEEKPPASLFSEPVEQRPPANPFSQPVEQRPPANPFDDNPFGSDDQGATRSTGLENPFGGDDYGDNPFD
jgi:hypothetical protein